MSPASQGALEVERYIGSCLISASGRPGLPKALAGCRKPETPQVAKAQGQFAPVGTWAGGAPLISMAANPRRGGQRPAPAAQVAQPAPPQPPPSELHARAPLTRLAVHTQGAPLILSGRFPGARGKLHGSQAALASCVASLARCQQPPQRPGGKPLVPEQKKHQQQQAAKPGETAAAAGKEQAATANATNIDSLSIASDESSGSNNSENSLPRIIKPRKRRKKDRKPPVVGPLGAAEGKSPDEVQQAQMMLPANGPLLPEQQQPQQPHQQQQQSLKPYQNGSYDPSRYPGDTYYKGHRRILNNSNGNNNNNNNNNNNHHHHHHHHHHPHNNNNNNNSREPAYGRVHPGANCSPGAVAASAQSEDMRQQCNAGYRNSPGKMLDDNRNVVLAGCQTKGANGGAFLRHGGHSGGGNARFINDYPGEPVAIACQQEDCVQDGTLCRYCDPATLIWEVNEQGAGYPAQYLSDFRHRHHQQQPQHQHHQQQQHQQQHQHRFSQVPTTVFLAARPIICQEHASGMEFFDVAENPCLRLRAGERTDGAAILRRSWSDPTSYFSEEIVPNRGVGVIGDRGQSGSEGLKGRSSWRGDASTAESGARQPPSPGAGAPGSPGSPGSPGPLEVSTEIVTSPNGHRDLEIKFYSSSPTAYASSPEGAKGPFGFPGEEAANDSEEFSDIWSYHETKLQQDFRTLLQAEE